MAVAGKPVHTIVLDTGPIIKNDPAVSSLLAQSEVLVTVPSIISEIRDAATRHRVEVTLLPFLTLRSPQPNSLKVVSDFARRTGDLAVLSRPDLEILALAYELECERNGGDWRLRSTPGQKGQNGSQPGKEEESTSKNEQDKIQTESVPSAPPQVESGLECGVTPDDADKQQGGTNAAPEDIFSGELQHSSLEELHISPKQDQVLQGNEGPEFAPDAAGVEADNDQEREDESEESDSDGWITPSNIKKHQAKDGSTPVSLVDEPKMMQVATITSDFAMQNVLLQMNLNLLSSSLNRVRHLKTFILRCHACFGTTKDMSKQFCPRCGKPTLTRVACSTNANGEFKMHLKKNYQYNNRGERYSIPKPVSGTASGKVASGGGKGGWGQSLILAEDQKEYQKATNSGRRQKERDLMDEDYLPGILTGERGRAGGRPKIGAGRNVNAKKRS